MLALRYPAGFKRWHKETGEELYMLCKRAQYGLPCSGRRWAKERNGFFLTFFNRYGFKTRKCVTDPSVLVTTINNECGKILDSSQEEIQRMVDEVKILRRDTKDVTGDDHNDCNKSPALASPIGSSNLEKSITSIATEPAYKGNPARVVDCSKLPIEELVADQLRDQTMMAPSMEVDFASCHYLATAIHVDDVDAVTNSDKLWEFFVKVVNTRYKAKIADIESMLGVRRQYGTTPSGVRKGTFTQEVFIVDMYERFRQYITSAKTATTPFPVDKYMNKALGGQTPEEIKRNLDKGYQSLVGGLLWAARHSKPESQLGVNMLCSVMACPSDLAFEYGLHALKWMYQTRTEGIIARSDSNPEPISFVDSGWRPSSIDGKSTYGFV